MFRDYRRARQRRLPSKVFATMSSSNQSDAGRLIAVSARRPRHHPATSSHHSIMRLTSRVAVPSRSMIFLLLSTLGLAIYLAILYLDTRADRHPDALDPLLLSTLRVLNGTDGHRIEEISPMTYARRGCMSTLSEQRRLATALEALDDNGVREVDPLRVELALLDLHLGRLLGLVPRNGIENVQALTRLLEHLSVHLQRCARDLQIAWTTVNAALNL